MREWTKEQLQAITAKQKTLLISAGAGSGKTAVLVERIVTLVRQGCRLNRMLIVTFTRAAASEMRQRLYQRLMQEPDDTQIQTALDDLPGAEIGTIHSFCGHMLRSYFQYLSLDPSFTICDEIQKKQLFTTAWEEAMNALLTEDAASISGLTGAYTQDQLYTLTEKCYLDLMCFPEPFAWAHERLIDPDAPMQQSLWYRELMEECGRKLRECRSMMDQEKILLQKAGAGDNQWHTWQQDFSVLERTMEAGSDPEKLKALITCYSFERMITFPSKDCWDPDAYEAYKKTRDQRKKTIKEIQNWIGKDEETARRQLQTVRRDVQALLKLTERTANVYLRLKLDNNTLSYEDMEQMTYRLLQNQEIRAEAADRYDHLFIDECQDVSTIQDAMIQALHQGNTLFMVGDVKQSIYRFRKADPLRFMERMRSYSGDESAEERKIILQRNFRSNPGILVSVNQLFRSVMRRSICGMDYTGEDELIPGKSAQTTAKAEILMIEETDPENPEKKIKEDKLRIQAKAAAGRIRQLLQETYEADGETRYYEYRDIVVLLPVAADRAALIAETLEEEGIPVFCDYQEAAHFEPEIHAVIETLKVIQNPMQDEALIACLRITPFLLTDGELADIRLNANEQDSYWTCFLKASELQNPLGDRCRQALQTLEKWRFEAQQMPLSAFLWKLVREMGLYAASGALPRGTDRQGLLALLCQQAETYESLGGASLAEFIGFMEEMQAGKDSLTARTLGEQENLVRIMTVHKSKGLEFPCVILLAADEKLNKDQGSALLCSARLGISLPCIDTELRIKEETLYEMALKKEERREERAEKARLLYVAVTRAKEKLVIPVLRPENEACWHMPEGDDRIAAAETYADWIMQAVYSDPDSWVQIPAADMQGAQQSGGVKNTWQWMGESMQEEESPDMQSWEERVRSFADRKQLKTSVTAVAEKQRQSFLLPQTEQQEETRERKELGGLLLSSIPAEPEFLKKSALRGASLGTAMHQVLSMLRLEELAKATYLELELRRQLSAIQKSGGPALPGEREFQWILRFFRHPLGQRMLLSPEVHREWHFNLLKPGDVTLMQGIIDAAFLEAGEWVLFDYKTDHIQDEEEFVRRYALQLSLYRTALEMITGKRVKEVCLYALSVGKAYPVICST